MDEEIGKNELSGNVSRRHIRFLWLWAIGILLLYAIGGFFMVAQLRGYKAETERNRQARIKAVMIAPNTFFSNATKQPEEVPVGVYVHRIGEFSSNESSWTADFDIWFRWTGDKVKPGESFQIANGQVNLRELREAFVTGGNHYERYHINARMSDSIDALRFPISDVVLTIQVNETKYDARTMRYLADQQGSGYSRRGIPPTMSIAQMLSAVPKPVRGPSRSDPNGTSYPYYVFAMLANPPSGRLFLTLFQALYASVLLAMLGAFIRPINGDGRFGVGIGAFFAAVGNNIYVASVVPQANQFTLTSMVNLVCIGTIVFTLIQSVLSLHIFETGKEDLSLLFDKVSFAVLMSGCLVVNVLLPLAAR
jgi:hypothetical protein